MNSYKNPLIALVILTIFFSCAKMEKEESAFQLLSTEAPDGYILLEEGFDESSFMLKSFKDEALLPPLPDSLLTVENYGIYTPFLRKNFVNNMDAAIYDIKSVVGHLFKKTEKGFDQISITPFVKSDTLVGNYIKKDVEYVNQKITDKYDVSITIAFLELGSDKERTFEMLIKDEAAFILNNNSISKKKLKQLRETLGSEADKYFFSIASTLSSVTHKSFEKTNRVRGGITATWMTAKGNKYIEEKNLTYLPKVHVDLINFKDMILD